MPVTDLHPEYIAHSAEWSRTEDAAIGSPALRRKNSIYLPEPYATEDPDRYAEFCLRAYYLNLTGRTERVLQGMVFRKSATYTMPKKLEALLEDMDGNGESIEQIAKLALIQRLRKDRFVFLADYPGQTEGMTEAQEVALGLHPVCVTYTAENLINWRWASVAGKKQLVLAVLKERENVSPDEFGHTCVDRFRVLRLRDGVYSQQLYDTHGEPLGDEITPTYSRARKTFDHIPLHGVRQLETAALQPVAEVNLAYYRNTAAIEDMVSIIGAAGLHIDVGDTTIEEWNANNSGKVKVGSRAGIRTKGGRVEFFQAEERPLLRTVREDKMGEMAAIGASIVTRGGQTETAEAARIRAGSETSQLDNIVGDLSEDLEAVLEDMARFLNVDPDSVNYKLNTDFFEAGLTAGDLTAIVAGKILYGSAAALHMIRKGKIELPPDMSDEDILESAAGEDFIE